MQESKAIGTYWSVPDANSPQAVTIEEHLDFLFKFYEEQIEQRKWYGFLDYGDFMHTYDTDRHSWVRNGRVPSFFFTHVSRKS